MRKTTLSFMLLAGVAIQSCNVNPNSTSSPFSLSSPVSGKTVYLLTINDYSVRETQLHFASADLIEAKSTLIATDYDCINYKNSKDSEAVKLLHYSMNNDVLEIPDLNITVRLTELENGDIQTSSRATLYKESIVEHLNDSVGFKRVQAQVSSRKLIDIYMTMINNNADPMITEKEEVNSDGTTTRVAHYNTDKNKNNPYKVNPLGGNRND